MAQPYSVQSPDSIHPTLKAALSSLDLQLEEELARYRRSRLKPLSKREVRSERLQPLELFEPGREPSLEPPLIEETSIPELTEELPPQEVSSLVYVPSPPDEEFVNASPSAPRDYLASSEELLRTLEDSPSPKGNRQILSFLTPFSIGSILVLLVASALLGSALMDAEGLRFFNWDEFREAMRTPRSTAPEDTPEPTPLQDTSIPNVPNLASSEFVELNLETLSTLPVGTSESLPETQQTPVTPSMPAPAEVSPDLPSALLPPGLRPQLEGTPPEVIPAPAPTDPNYYFVMVEYSGQDSLQTAQSIVIEAYPVQLPQGIHIQMGAFPAENQARELVEDLQQKGLTAKIYRPEQ